jgi:hypothetical protein
MPVVIMTRGDIPLCSNLAEINRPPIARQAPGNRSMPVCEGVKFNSLWANTRSEEDGGEYADTGNEGHKSRYTEIPAF